MRALADELGATAMALYRHVGDRDELSLLVIDEVFSRLTFPKENLGAVSWLRELAHAVRALGRAHHGVMDVLLDEGPVVKGTLVVLDRVVQKLHDEGMSWKAATAVHNTFFSWLAATIRREERWTLRSTEARPPLRRFLDVAATMSTSDYPGLSHALSYMPGTDVDTEFERSLTFMLDGVARQLEVSQSRQSSGRARSSKR